MGIGRELMKEGVKRTTELYPRQGIRISAQAYLEKFYGEFGFRTVRGPYDEDGIPHLEMLLWSGGRIAPTKWSFGHSGNAIFAAW